MKFIKVTDDYGYGEFYINPSYIVTIRPYKQMIISGTSAPNYTEMRYQIEYYNNHHLLTSGHINKEDYDYLMNNSNSEAYSQFLSDTQMHESK